VSRAGNLKVLDYFQMVSSVLFLLLGLLILLRSLSLKLTPLVLLVSLGFILLGAYRLVLIYFHFRSQRK